MISPTPVLVWKDEYEGTGPTRLYPSLEAYETHHQGIPWGTRPPGKSLGWMTRTAAKQAAEEHNATFKEG